MLEEKTYQYVAKTSDQVTGELVNSYGHRGILVTLVVTSAGTGEIDNLEIQVADGNGSYKKMYTLPTTANIASNGTYLFLLYPAGSTMNATEFVGTPVIGVLPRRFRILVSHFNSNAMTYKLTYMTLG